MILGAITLKRKIALGYTLLLIILLSTILTVSYNIVGYQFERDIEKNLLLKQNLISRILNPEQHSTSEHSEEHSEKRESRSESKENYEIESNNRSESREHSEKTEENRREKSRNKRDESDTRNADSNSRIEATKITSNSSNRLKFINESFSRIIDNDLALYYVDGSLQYSNRVNSGSYIDISSDINSLNLSNITVDKIEFLATSIKTSEGILYIGSELTDLKTLQNRLLNIFIISSIIGIILSIIFGMIVTQQSMNIIKRITKTTKSITSNNLNMRIDCPKGDDEITELVVTLNSMINRLEIAFLQSKQFTQDAAHEIRTPLTIIRGELDEILSQNILTGIVTERLSSMLNEVHYLSSISERLLLINSIDSGTIQYDFKQINLTELMDDIYQDAKIISGEREIDISIECAPNIYINCNQELITRLLWNLIDNAIKYNRDRGTISLSVKEFESEIMIQVKDSGIGIPQNDINKIFDRFYRVDKSHSRKINGSGLGLSICKWIVDLHKGTIKAISERGSIFTVLLPK